MIRIFVFGGFSLAAIVVFAMIIRTQPPPAPPPTLNERIAASCLANYPTEQARKICQVQLMMQAADRDADDKAAKARREAGF